MLDLIWLIPALPLLGFLDPGRVRPPSRRSAGRLLRRRRCSPAPSSSPWRRSSTSSAPPPRSGPTSSRCSSGCPSASLQVDMAFLADPLSIAMCLFVTGVGTLIHVYAVGYMHGDPKFSKFFCYLNLFAFSMLVLVLGENMLVTFLGWEGVGHVLVPADLVLAHPGVGGDRRQEGVHHQPGRRLGLHGGDVPRLRRRRVAELLHRQRGGDPGRPRPVDGDGDRRDAVHRRRRQERPAPAVPLAPRRDGGSDPGVGA